MGECNSVKHDFNETPNMYPNISNDQQFRQNKINEIKDFFTAEIRERELMNKNLSKYISFVEYLEKSIIVLSVATGRISIASFATAIWAPVGIMSASCSLAFLITAEFIKRLEIWRKNTIKLLS